MLARGGGDAVSEAAEFLRDIRGDPTPDGPRLAYANWLEQRGDPFGEFIRVQCALERHDCDDEDVRRLRQREQDLLAANNAAWLGAFAADGAEWDMLAVYRRGFVETIGMPAQRFLDHSDRLEA